MKKIYFYYSLLVILGACSGDNGGEVIIKPPVDNPKPVAVNDTYNAVEDNELIISDLLTNDTVIATATITSIDASSSNNGTIVDNRNGTYSYNPPAGFVGEDTFKYTLCDRDNTPDCSTATVTITVNDEGSPV
ncbi:MAG: Ig-like domain-containing protein, partial [Aureibaculum sp.]